MDILTELVVVVERQQELHCNTKVSSGLLTLKSLARKEETMPIERVERIQAVVTYWMSYLHSLTSSTSKSRHDWLDLFSCAMSILHYDKVGSVSNKKLCSVAAMRSAAKLGCGSF